jgi:hypothetical protein
VCGHVGWVPFRTGCAAGGLAQTTKELTAISHQDFETTAAEGRAACGGADLVVSGFLAEDLANDLRTELGVPRHRDRWRSGG